MAKVTQQRKRIVLIRWKEQNQVEIFSNLKNFCLSYPRYNYNTLSNYLSKEKIAYENDVIRVERKEIITRPHPQPAGRIHTRSIAPVARRIQINKADDSSRDLQYWLDQPVNKRAEAVTFLVSQMLKKGQRMDKTIVNKIKSKVRHTR